MICCGSHDGPPSAYKVGLKDKSIDITVDEEGNTFVNGKKMDEEKLEDGTSIFLFRNSEVKKAEDWGV